MIRMQPGQPPNKVPVRDCSTLEPLAINAALAQAAGRDSYSDDRAMIQTQRPLTRILGLGFGLAMVFGGTAGVGILRLPGTWAAALGDSRLIVLFWILGGLYSLLGAVAVAELAAMLPEAGGFYVYARRAFGNGPGFVVGWSDWVNQIASLAYGALTAAVFLGTLWPPAAAAPRVTAIAMIALFTAFHWGGLRIGSTLTSAISLC